MRSVLVGTPDETVVAAARRMAEHDVGSVVVVDDRRRPVGVLTDRDIALRCVAPEKDPRTTPISVVMTAPMTSVTESTPIESALALMAGIHARRLAVVDDAGRLVGLLAMDDVLELLVEEAESIGRILAKRHPPLEG